MPILIDGHNLIGQMPGLSLEDPHDEEMLVTLLRSYRARTGKEVQEFTVPAGSETTTLQVTAKLMNRKVDQFLINFLLGEDSGLTAPVVEMARVEADIPVSAAGGVAGGGG